MIQAFWSQLTGVFETYDTSEVKDLFENINILMDYRHIIKVIEMSDFFI